MIIIVHFSMFEFKLNRFLKLTHYLVSIRAVQNFTIFEFEISLKFPKNLDFIFIIVSVSLLIKYFIFKHSQFIFLILLKHFLIPIFHI